MSFIASFRRAALGALLTLAAAAASAGPTYHVTVDATGWSGPGYLDLAFSSAGWPGAVATVSHLNTVVNGVETIGNAADLGAGSYSVESFGYNDLSLLLDFGSVLQFDLSFDGDMFSNMGEYQSALVVSLLDTGYNPLNDGAIFTLSPITDEAPVVGVEIGTDRLTSVTAGAAVPEASQWAIFLTGLSLMAWTVRRRQQR